MKEFIINILDVLIPLGLGTITVYLNLLFRKLKIKAEYEIEKLENENAEAIFKAAIDRVDILAEKTVAAFEQTIASDLRQQVKAGITNKEDLIKACEGAYFKVYGELKPKYVKALKNSYIDISEYIQNVIEEKLIKLKGELYGNNN